MCMCIFTLQVLNHSGREEAYLVFADKCRATTWETQRCFAFFALPYGWGEGSCFTSQTESICAQARGLLVRWDLARLTWRAVLCSQDDCLCVAIPATVHATPPSYSILLPDTNTTVFKGQPPNTKMLQHMHCFTHTDNLLNPFPESSIHWTFNIKAF